MMAMQVHMTVLAWPVDIQLMEHDDLVDAREEVAGIHRLPVLDPRTGDTADARIGNPIPLPDVNGEDPPGHLFHVSIGEVGEVLACDV
jgi:hypothetical protein